MKDCSTCRNRIEFHPEYKTMAFTETPCAHCSVNINDRNTETFTPEKDYGELIAETYKHRATLGYFIFLDSLTPMQRAVIKLLIDNPTETKSNLARLMGMSRIRFYQHLDNIRHRYNEIKAQQTA